VNGTSGHSSNHQIDRSTDAFTVRITHHSSPFTLILLVPLKFCSWRTDTTSIMNNSMATSTQMIVDGAASTESEILTVLDVARFLRVPKSTVYKLARLGELPASKIGKHWRFLRRDINQWMHSRSSQG
jgi:excisionase family DNA binding protein